MAEHSKVVGGSTVSRLIGCPASLRLVKAAPPQRESSFAAHGTLLHSAMERLMLGTEDPVELLGLTQQDFGGAAGGPALELEDTPLLENALASFNEIADLYNITDVAVEVKADWESVIPGAFGWIDVIGFGPTHNMILDWKFGRGVPVSAENNNALLYYAAGAMLSHPQFNNDLPTVLAVIQPTFEEGNSEWVVTSPDLLDFIQEVKDALARANTPSAQPCKGSWCKFCPAKVTCPAMTNMARELHARIGQKANTFGGDELAHLLTLAADLDPWIKELRATAQYAAEQGTTVPGYKLVKKKVNRSWGEPATLLARLKSMRIPLRDSHNHILKSPAQLEKLLQSKGKTLDFKQYLSTTTSTGISLVPDTDKRPATTNPLADAPNLKELL